MITGHSGGGWNAGGGMRICSIIIGFWGRGGGGGSIGRGGICGIIGGGGGSGCWRIRGGEKGGGGGIADGIAPGVRQHGDT